MTKRGFAVVELLVALAILGLLAALAIPAISRSREANRRTTCQGNLKQLGVILTVYAEENKGRYPRIQGDPVFGRVEAARGCDALSFTDNTAFAPDTRALYPDYMTDFSILVCPSAPFANEDNPLGIVRDDGSGTCEHTGFVSDPDRSYYYLGYALDSDEPYSNALPTSPLGPTQVSALMVGLAPSLFDRDPLTDVILDRDVDLRAFGLGGLGLGNKRGDTISRLEYGGKNLLGIAQRVIPLMWDHANRDSSGALVHNHPVRGGNVLYMDGSVRYTNFAEGIPDGIHLSMLVEPF